MAYPQFRENQYRSEYILLKDQSIKNIADAYYEAGTNITTQYIKSKNIDMTMGAVRETTVDIEARFIIELAKINTQAVESVALPIVQANIPYSELVRQAWKQLPFALASAAFLDKIPLEIQKMVGANVQLTGIPISKRIWGDEKIDSILSVIRYGIQQKQSSFAIAEALNTSILQGSLHKQVYRLAYTELTYANSYSKVTALRKWNEDPDSMFELGIKQYLSPSHVVYDICDVLAGTYSLDEPIPAIGRHPHCNCGQEIVIIEKQKTLNKKWKSTTDEEVLTY